MRDLACVLLLCAAFFLGVLVFGVQEMSEYDWFTCIVAVLGGSILGAVILWDLLEELKNGR